MKSSGGGTLIAIRNHIICTQITTSIKHIECVFILCKFNSSSALIGSVYIPPGQPLSTYVSFCDILDEIMNSLNEPVYTFIMGDFNLPATDWTNPSSSILPPSSRYMMDVTSSYELKQVNYVKNFRGVCLDLIFSSDPNLLIRSAEDLLLEEDRHHPALTFNFETIISSSSSGPKDFLDFRRCNVHAVFDIIQTLSYPLPNSSENVEMAFDKFCTNLRALIRSHTPLKKTASCNFPQWFTRDLRNMVIRKKILHTKYKSSLSPIDYVKFQQIRRECKALAVLCHSNYIGKVEESIPSNIKSFWTHVNNKKSSPDFPSTMILDSANAMDADGKCDLFSRYFASVFGVDDVPVPVFDFGWNQSISNCTFSALDVQRKLEALNPNKGAGPDSIPPAVLKYCAPVLAPHLAIYFKELLSVGIFPSVFKQSYVVPIYKSGDKNNVRNYRPIAIQPALSKIYESLILDHLYFQLRNCISPEQHGFLRGRSPTTNLLVFRDFIMEAFAESCQVDCVYLDFSKAFDKLNHRLLIAKLEGYGICGPLLHWLKSYISDRTLIVKCEGGFSRPFPVTSGVPQGSHLGPLLFLLFVNDISAIIPSRFLLFADDIKVFNKIFSSRDQDELQNSMDSIKNWCSSNAMELNVSKCLAITFSRSTIIYTYDYSINGISLQVTQRVRDLGVITTPSLSPYEHLLYVSSRASSMLGFIFRSTRDFRSPQTLVILYKSLVRPLMEYCSVVWFPYQAGHIAILDRIQTRFLRLLGLRTGYRYLDTPLSVLEERYNLQPLPLRRRCHDLLCLHKIVNGAIDCADLLKKVDFAVPRSTRSKSVFSRRFQPTNYAVNHGITRLLRSGGEVSQYVDFFVKSSASFKKDVLQVSIDL